MKVTDENSRIRIRKSKVRICGSGSGPKCHGSATSRICTTVLNTGNIRVKRVHENEGLMLNSFPMNGQGYHFGSRRFSGQARQDELAPRWRRSSISFNTLMVLLLAPAFRERPRFPPYPTHSSYRNFICLSNAFWDASSILCADKDEGKPFLLGRINFEKIHFIFFNAIHPQEGFWNSWRRLQAFKIQLLKNQNFTIFLFWDNYCSAGSGFVPYSECRQNSGGHIFTYIFTVFSTNNSYLVIYLKYCPFLLRLTNMLSDRVPYPGSYTSTVSS